MQCQFGGRGDITPCVSRIHSATREKTAEVVTDALMELCDNAPQHPESRETKCLNNRDAEKVVATLCDTHETETTISMYNYVFQWNFIRAHNQSLRMIWPMARSE